MKMLGEVADDPNVGPCGTMGVITSLEFLQHFLAKLGHRDLLFLWPNLSQTLVLATSYQLIPKHAQASAAQRLRPNLDFTQMPTAEVLSEITCSQELTSEWPVTSGDRQRGAAGRQRKILAQTWQLSL